MHYELLTPDKTIDSDFYYKLPIRLQRAEPRKKKSEYKTRRLSP